MVKKTKLNAFAWLTNVIFLLQKGDMSVADVFEMTSTPRTEVCESLLYEHPSIRFENDRLYWHPFANINNQDELLDLLRAKVPMGVRRIDMRGLYPFIDADLDELLFRGTIVQLDARQDSFTISPSYTRIPDEVKQLFNNVVAAM